MFAEHIRLAVINGIGALKIQFLNVNYNLNRFSCYFNHVDQEMFHLGVESILIASIVSNVYGYLLAPIHQFAAGPPVENGFYYDLDLPTASPGGFPENRGGDEKGDQGQPGLRADAVTRDEAIGLREAAASAASASARASPASSSSTTSADIPEGEEITYYKNGDFLDLCAGPHVMRTGNIGAFKLTSVASAYYKGDEKNPQLQRIYGTAFKNKTEMEAYFTMLEEAKSATTASSARKWDSSPLTRIRRPRPAALAAERHRHHRGTGKARQGNRICRRLRPRADAAHRAREHVPDQRALPVLTQDRCFRR